MTLSQAFDLGFNWARRLHGQNVEDSRAVGRTLLSDDFAALDLNVDSVPSFRSADVGIVLAKQEIMRALDANEATERDQGMTDQSGMSAMTERGALDLAIATLQERVRDRDREIKSLTAALAAQRSRPTVDLDTIRILLDLLNPLHGSLDQQLYDDRMLERRDGYDIPPDREWDVNVTDKQERDLTLAVLILENSLEHADHAEPFVKVADIKEGDILKADCHHTCMRPGSVHVVKMMRGKPFVDCDVGPHFFDLSHSSGEIKGMWKVNVQAGEVGKSGAI